MAAFNVVAGPRKLYRRTSRYCFFKLLHRSGYRPRDANTKAKLFPLFGVAVTLTLLQPTLSPSRPTMGQYWTIFNTSKGLCLNSLGEFGVFFTDERIAAWLVTLLSSAGVEFPKDPLDGQPYTELRKYDSPKYVPELFAVGCALIACAEQAYVTYRANSTMQFLQKYATP